MVFSSMTAFLSLRSRFGLLLVCGLDGVNALPHGRASDGGGDLTIW